MLKTKFRFRPGHRGEHPAPPWRLKTLFLNLTDACNQSCLFCHASADPGRTSLPPASVARLLDEAAAFGRPTIVLTGGEPLLYPDLAAVLKMCRARDLTCKIATNGTLLDDATVGRFVDHRVRSLQIALDTLDPARHARLKKTTPASHAALLEGIGRAVRAEKLHIALSSVVLRSSVPEWPALLRFGHDAGVATFTLYHLIPTGRGAGLDGDRLAESEFLDALDGLLETFASLPRHWAVDLGYPWAEGSRILERWKDRLDIRPIGCLAGKTHLTVLADGTAVPCVGLGDPAMSCGRIGERTLEELWRAPVMRYFRDPSGIEGCRECARAESCRTGCRAMSFLRHGRLDAPDPICAAWR